MMNVCSLRSVPSGSQRSLHGCQESGGELAHILLHLYCSEHAHPILPLPPSLSSPLLPFPSSQIADQVGELLIHCRYGCKAQADNSEEYEVEPEGEYLMSCDVM